MPAARFAGKSIPIGLGLLLVALFLWIQHTGHGGVAAIRDRLEYLAYDLRLSASLPDRPTPPAEILIVDIDEASLQQEGRWPWPRARMAELLARLQQAGAAVVAFDMVLSEAETNAAVQLLDQLPADVAGSELARRLRHVALAQDGDTRLAGQIAAGDTVLGVVFHNQNSAPVGRLPEALFSVADDAPPLPVPALSTYTANRDALQDATAYAGFLTALPDADGVIRRAPLLLRHGDGLYPALALETARAYLLSERPRLSTTDLGTAGAIEGIDLGGRLIPTDAAGRVLVPYRGPAGSFAQLSAAAVLRGEFAAADIANRIALIGTSALALADLKATPVQSVYPGVEVHASLLAGILSGHFPHEPAWAPGASFLLLLLAGSLLAVLLPLLSPTAQLALGTLTVSVLIAFNAWLWNQAGLVLVIATPVLLILSLAVLNLGYGFLFEARGRRQLKDMFGQYVPPALVEEMNRAGERYDFSGESRELSVLFADIRSFTTISEALSAADLKSLLNRFFTPMTRVIFDRRGTIDKYVGDMIMAFWGAPLRDAEHAEHAVAAALDMLRALTELRAEFAREGLPEIAIGIGINSGLMNVGDMGSHYRRAYTVIGDAVNLASRLEGLTKYYGVDLVVGPRTRELAPGFVYRRLDRVRVKGKREAVEVFAPLCRAQELGDNLRVELTMHEQALEHFWRREWPQAQAMFTELQTAHPQSVLYALYLERIGQLRGRTLPDDWDGVYERREK
ncbi:MAG TPA: adenylate/guanylate cyclase domain-containing protein [Gammaproteobacteria bacterium]